MGVTRYIPLLIALLVGGWLVFDGTRAFAVGDYLTAKTGERAGQLGPWSRVVSAVGLDPRSTAVKSIHVALGVLWIVSAVLFLVAPENGKVGLLVCSVASLWYAPMGTILGLAEIGVLIFLKAK